MGIRARMTMAAIFTTLLRNHGFADRKAERSGNSSASSSATICMTAGSTADIGSGNRGCPPECRIESSTVEFGSSSWLPTKEKLGRCNDFDQSTEEGPILSTTGTFIFSGGTSSAGATAGDEVFKVGGEGIAGGLRTGGRAGTNAFSSLSESGRPSERPSPSVPSSERFCESPVGPKSAFDMRSHCSFIVLLTDQSARVSFYPRSFDEPSRTYRWGRLHLKR